jgi:NCS2 family nucleobase:cation symporter-2
VLFENGVGREVRTEASFMTAFGVLVTMTSLAIWARGLPKLLCVLIGILVGYAVAASLGVFPEHFALQLSESPFFALPDPGFLSYGFEPSFMVPFAVAGLASGLRVVGVLTTCQQMNDASWRRPDMKNIQGGVMADAVGCGIGGALGTPGMSASPSLVGIAKTTGATSRVIALSIAGWLMLLSCFPKFSSLIINMPRPVMAAALFFNGSLMFVAGIQIVASRPITLRASLIIGFSILMGMSVMIFPEFYKSLPQWTHQFTGSEITVAVISSVALNALFLVGTWRYGQLRLGAEGSPLTAKTFDDFFVNQAKEWKISAEDIPQGAFSCGRRH